MPPRPKSKEKRLAIEKSKVQDRETTRAKVEELLAQPMSAFVMFGFAQRNLLKKQKPGATVKEVVKAVGDRWLLLAEAERQKYEVLAAQDAARPAQPQPQMTGDDGGSEGGGSEAQQAADA
mmetsp:Transcript_2610/g.5086  ORF Transcript_2610/g.5086 Transcript_2610/m.5086 type:complete len:121 (-) Transcript_2610:191-553(-)